MFMFKNDVSAAARMEQSDREFEETGSTPWLRAIDEAEAIGRQLFVPSKQKSMSERIQQLDQSLHDLAWRGDDLEVEVTLQPMRGLSMTLPLRQTPEALRMLAQAA